MSLPSLNRYLEGYSNLYTSLIEDNVFNTANDFDLAIKDISLLNVLKKYKNFRDRERTKNNFYPDLNHFVVDKPYLYKSSVEEYSAYLTFYMIITICKEQEVSIKTLQTFYTNHMLDFLLSLNTDDVEATSVLKYWKKVLPIVKNFVKQSYNYKKVNTTTMVTFYCPNCAFKIHIPLIGYNSDGSIDIHYYGCHLNVRPAWYTTPSIYKIYDYFLSRNIRIKNFHYSSINLTTLGGIDTITIPFTDNVKTLVYRYKDIEPYPYRNLFYNTQDKYTLQPLGKILNEN